MAAHVVNAKSIGAVLRRDRVLRMAARKQGITRAARRSEAHMRQKTRDSGKVWLSQFIKSWDVQKSMDGTPMLINDAPHAGIIEEGARPHSVSQEGREHVREWVRRKVLGISMQESLENAETDQITEGIIRKLKLYGQEPTYLVRNELPKFRKFVQQECERATKDKLSKPPRGAK